MVGSASYMAPDYINGGNYSTQSEIYSFGTVLYECLTGLVPFLDKNLLETLYLHAHSEVKSLNEIRQDSKFPQELEDFISKCLAKNPSDRFESMEQIKSVLRENFLRTEDDQENKTVDSRKNLIDKDSLKKKKQMITMVLLVMLSFGFLTVFTVATQNKSDLDEKTASIHRRQKSEAKPWFPEREEPFTQKKGINGNMLWRPRDFQNIKDEQFKWLVNKEPLNVRLSGCATTGTGLKYILNWPITNLQLGNSAITDKGLGYVGKFPNLDTIILNTTAITDSGLSHLGKLKKLKTFDVRECKAVTDKGLSNIIKNNKKLKVLRISYCGATSKTTSLLNQLANLEELQMNGLDLKDADLLNISKHKGLRDLRISNNPQITDRGLSYILSLKNLHRLSIFGCPKLTQASIASLEKRIENVEYKKAKTGIQKRMDDALELLK